MIFFFCVCILFQVYFSERMVCFIPVDVVHVCEKRRRVWDIPAVFLLHKKPSFILLMKDVLLVMLY